MASTSRGRGIPPRGGGGPDAETPISKYLAQLERRKTVYVSPSARAAGSGSDLLSPEEFGINRTRFGFGSQSSVGPFTKPVTMRLDFEDSDASMLHISPQNPQSTRMSIKRPRTSRFPWEDEDDVDVQKLTKKNSELERLLRETQAELISSRASQTKLEHLNNEMQRSHKEKIIQFENAEVEMKIKCKNANQKCEELEKQLQVLERKGKDVSESTEQQRTAYSRKSLMLDEKNAALQRENFQLNQKLTQEMMKSEDALRKLRSELSETEMGAEKWIMDSQILRDQLALAQKQLQNCQNELKIAQVDAVKYQEFKSKYETEMSSNATENLFLEELKKKYENLYLQVQQENYKLDKDIKKLKDENEIMRSSIKTEMILEEKITSLESQVRYMTQELKDKGACDAERNVLKEELKAWKLSAEKLEFSCTTPLNFEKMIRQLQNMLFEFKHENSDLKHNVEHSNRLVSTLQSEGISLREQLKTLKEEKEKLTMDVKKMSRRLVLIVKDRDGLRELKESYEQEFEGMISEPLKERISQLQNIVLEYENLLKEEEQAKKPCPECEQRKPLLLSLQAQLDETIREKELLSQTLANQTVDETTGVKIVAFGNNPSMMTVEARLRECLAENETLKQKLKGYEDNTLVGITDESLLEEKKKLDDQLRVLERKHEILTQAYDYETVQLQQACSKLFGYHVTLVREPQNQVRLQSIYSTCADHVFIFQEADNNDDMMLLETPILDHFRDDIERFLIGEGSIPGFLSSVTITYTQGQQSSMMGNVSEEQSGEQNITVLAVHGADGSQQQYQQLQPPPGGLQGSSEVQIQIEGESSNEGDDDEESELHGEEEEEEEHEHTDDERDDSENEAEHDQDDDDIYGGMSEHDEDDEEDEDGQNRNEGDDDDGDDSDVVMIDSD